MAAMLMLGQAGQVAWLFVLGVAALALVALIVAVRAWHRLQQIEDELISLRRAQSRAQRPLPTQAPTPLPPKPTGAATASPPPPPQPASPVAPGLVKPPLAATGTPLPASSEPSEPPVALTDADAVASDQSPPKATTPQLIAAVAAARAAASSSSPSSVTTAAPPPASSVRSKLATSLEEKLGVWAAAAVGAVALAIAGIYLVKFSFDHGILRVEVRMSLGALFGLALIGAGDWLRRQSPRVGQGLVAAGVANLFAVLLACVTLYEILPTVVGFALMIVLTAAAVALSLRHGMLVAVLGLIGGFITPALIGQDEPMAGPLFSYLLVLQIALVVISRRRGWWPLEILTLMGGLAWVIFWFVAVGDPVERFWLVLFMVGSATLFVLSAGGAGGPARATTAVQPGAVRLALAYGGAIASLILLAWTVRLGEHTPLDWGMFALLGAGAIALARLDGRYILMPFLAAACSFTLLLTWGLDDIPPTFLRQCLMFGLLYGVAGYACLWPVPKLPQPTHAQAWAALSVTGTLAMLLLAYVGDFERATPMLEGYWGWLAGAAAALYALASWPVLLRRDTMRQAEAVANILVAAVVVLVMIALAMELRGRALTLGWVALTPLLALAQCRLRLLALRWLSAIVAVLVLWRMIIHPGPAADYGMIVLWNPLLVDYGLPLAAFVATAWLLHRTGDSPLVRFHEGVAAVAGFLLVTLQVRHGFHHPQLRSMDTGLMELATYSVAWLAAGVGTHHLGRQLQRTVIDRAGVIAVMLGVIAAVVGCGLIANPLWSDEPIHGVIVVNTLLYIYGLPAALTLVAAVRFRHDEALKPLAVFLGAVGLLMMFILVSLQVRHAFHGPQMGRKLIDPLGLIEFATYGVAWLIVGMGLYQLGRQLQRNVADRAGLVMMVLGVLASVLGGVFVLNPLWTEQSIAGMIVFNSLLYIYGVPALLILLAALLLRHDETVRPVAVIMASASLLLLFALVSLQVRHAFHGPVLHGERPGAAEWYAYSAAWIGFGALLLILGISLRQAALRYASLAVMVLVVIKVFVFDMANLRDLYRVASFLGLGLSLMLLAYLYQRFVFRQPAIAEKESSVDEEAGKAGM